MTATDQPPITGHKEAKAQAKAAKAYAKASRPWFKKKRFLIPGALVVLIVIIVVATSGGGGDTAPTADTQTNDNPSQAPSDTNQEPADTGNGPLAVGNWEVVGKIKPQNDGLGDFTATFRVTNVSDSPDSAWFTVNVLNGEDIWASMDCVGSEVAPGSVGTIDCLSSDKFRKGWSDVTIENAF